MQSSVASVRSLCALLFVVSLCCCLSACAGRGTLQTEVHSNPVLDLPQLSPPDSLWVSVQNSTESADSGESLQAVLVAFLQSDAGIRMADSEAAADYILRVNILQAGLTGTMPMDMDIAEGLGSATAGAMLGFGVGNAVSPDGAAWGAGAGLVLGLGIGYASTANDNEDTWTMLADVQVQRTTNVKNSSNIHPIAQSHMEATVYGTNLTRERAIPSLEDALAQEIAKYFKKESS